MKNIAELEKSYSKLLGDDKYDLLSLELNKPNIFKILGVSNYELKHSNFLGWLLDPNESHDLGNLFLTRFLTEVFLDERSEEISLLEIGKIDAYEIEVRREWKNIDLLIVSNEFVVCIENKIWAKESKNQLRKYKTIVDENFKDKKKVFVFLTPYGDEASLNDIYINISYNSVISILENIVNNRKKIIGESILTYIEDYISILKQVLMKNENVNQWASELYKNHRELFDFVWENKPDFQLDFANILMEKMESRGFKIGSKNKGFVRFYPREMEDVILKYKRANGWPNKEAFLFEFDFHNNTNLIFRTVVSPYIDYEKYDTKIVEILNDIEGASKKLGKKWKCHFSNNKKWDINDEMNNWCESSSVKLDSFIEDQLNIITKVEERLIENASTLLELKSAFDNEL